METDYGKLFRELPDREYATVLEHGDPEKVNYARSFIHVHTDLGSPKDSVLTVSAYVENAVKMGASVLSVTDHGTMYAVPALYGACKKAGLKLLIGCEFYVCETVEDKDKKKHTRLHLCAYARDKVGYLALAQMVTASNSRIITVGDLQFPCISKKILVDMIGPGAKAHGHVVLTSACIGGVLAGISYANEDRRSNIQDIEEKLTMYREIILAKGRIRYTMDDIADKLASFHEQIASCPTPEEKDRLVKQIAAFKDMEKQAKRELAKLSDKADAAAGIKNCSDELLEKRSEELKEKVELQKAALLTEDQIMEKLKEEAIWYSRLSGPGCFFIELQYHGIPAEKKYMPDLADLAEALKLPTLAANDVHMAKRSDCEVRKFINSLRFNQYEPAKEGDTELYLKNDIELFRALSKIMAKEQAWRAMKGRETLASMCNVTLEKELHYPKYIA